MHLAGKLALITGGGRGIGRAIALQFAAEGAELVLSARTAQQVDQVAKEAGVRSLAIDCDVSKPENVRHLFSALHEKFGRGPDILVNNAGIAESATIIKTDDDLWNRHLAINLSGTFYCTRAALPSMLARGWGRIINIASIAGKTGAPYTAAYSASKHGVLGLTRCTAVEVGAKGITANAICPGYVDTQMTTLAIENITAKTGRPKDDTLSFIKAMSPQQRLITTEEVAALAVLLASDLGRGINGQAINVDGGAVVF